MNIGLLIHLLKKFKTGVMKKIIICTVLLAFVATSLGQQSVPKQHWTDSEYYKKSKKQKTAAWIFACAGSAVLLTTLITDAFSSAITGVEKSASGIAIPYALGAACVATGVVLFVASKELEKSKINHCFFSNGKSTCIATSSHQQQVISCIRRENRTITTGLSFESNF